MRAASGRAATLGASSTSSCWWSGSSLAGAGGAGAGAAGAGPGAGRGAASCAPLRVRLQVAQRRALSSGGAAAGAADGGRGAGGAGGAGGARPALKLETLVTLAGRGLASASGSAVHGAALVSDPFGSTSEPLYQTATFDVRAQDAFDYTRSGNPTRVALEQSAAVLDGAHAGFAFTSGMAALSAVLRLLSPGDRVCASKDIYGGMHRQLLHCQRASGLEVRFAATWDVGEVRRQLPFKMLCVESPTNPLMRVCDLSALARLCREHGALLVVDNSVLGPLLSRPLALGAHVVVHSATKHFAGHSDVMAGLALVGDEQDLARRLYFVQNAEGAGLAPHDAWLVLRGVKTMALRMAAAQRSAEHLYRCLLRHPAVLAVNWLARPGSTPAELRAAEAAKRGACNAAWRAEAELHWRQASGAGALMSFELASPEAAAAVVRRLRLFKKTVSFGSTSSLVEIPAHMSHAAVPAGHKTMSAALLRISVGIEDAEDLERDLEQALDSVLGMGVDGGGGGPGAAVAAPLTPPQPAVMRGSPPLGTPLPPDSRHAVGVSMPAWADVIAYEEGDARLHAKLQSGYPRFVFLAPVKRLIAEAERRFCGLQRLPEEERAAMVAPSARSALRLAEFLRREDRAARVEVHDMDAFGCAAVTFPAALRACAKKFWQHAGQIPSSRLALAVLGEPDEEEEEQQQQQQGEAEEQLDCETARPALRQRVAALAGARAHDVYLFPSGMAAIAASHRIAAALLAEDSEEHEEAEVSAADAEPATARRRGAPSTPGTPGSPQHSVYSACSAHSAGLDSSLGSPGSPSGASLGSSSGLQRRPSSDDSCASPSGPARLALARPPGRHVVVFGFPYLDTLKLANVLHDAPARFWGHGSEADVDALAAELEAGLSRPLAVYCEFPSNPLLRAPPLRRLRALCDAHGVPLVVDDSCAGVCNVDLLGPGGADMVVSSLTKQFCGAGTAMGGSLVLNRAARLAAPLKRAAERDYEPDMLFWRDAAVLLRCSMDLPQRARKSNATAVQLVSALKAHPRVRDVFHPTVDTERRQAFDEFRRKGGAAGGTVGGGGYGGIVSFVLRDPAHARTFFDAVNVPKGPGFGTNFSLLMLYTMLAHYHELPWAKQYGVDQNLMRLWCGQEDDLVERVLAALDALPAPAPA